MSIYSLLQLFIFTIHQLQFRLNYAVVKVKDAHTTTSKKCALNTNIHWAKPMSGKCTNKWKWEGGAYRTEAEGMGWRLEQRY